MEKAGTAASVMEYGSETHSTIGIGQELPPPAYQKPYSNSLKLTRTIAATVVAVTIILGIVVLLAIYIQTNSKTCSCSDDDLATAQSAPYVYRVEDPNGESIIAVSGDAGKRGPLKFQIDGETAGSIMRKSPQKSHVNCVIERKKATQIISHEPKMLITPYGNMTTDPRLLHVMGEKVTFSCQTNSKDTQKEKKEKNNKTASRPKRSPSMCACDCAC